MTRRWTIGLVFLMLSATMVQVAAALPGGAQLQFLGGGFDEEVVGISFAPGDDSVFVVERPGRIQIVEQDGTVRSTPFLDIDADVRSIDGLAFHPDYETNGLFYIIVVENPITNHILEYQVSADPNVADETTRRVIWTHFRESNAHRGGQMAFGPSDGQLYVSFGDGGPPPGDPFENGQDINTPDGAIIRIDPATGSASAGNPFIGGPGNDDIWLYGFRHPYRFSFDAVTGLMYIGEVGDGDLEEVNVVAPAQAGDNFGWDVMEGTSCYEAPEPGEAPCGDPIYVLPDLEYPHNEGCAIIGGYVYRGSAIPSMQGQYFYSDYCLGWTRSFEYVNGSVTNEQDWTSTIGSVPLITTYGEDNDGELYMAVNGDIYKIIPDGPPPAVGTIAGTVWDDTNSNGLQDGEPGFAGTDVELWIDTNLDGAADLEVQETVSDGSGSYSFPNLDITKQYVVRFDPPPGRALTMADVGGDDSIDSDADVITGFTPAITLSDGEVNDTIDAGVVVSPFGTVGGTTWRDLDGDGIQDVGEPGFSGLWAWLYEDFGADGTPDLKVDEVRVDENGDYDFPVDPAKTYFIKLGQQIYIDGSLTLVLPNRTFWSPYQIGSDPTIDSDANPADGFAGPATAAAGAVDLTFDGGLVSSSANYEDLVADDGAVAHWRLGEAAGTTANDAIGILHGSISGTIGWGEPGLVGGADTALRLDGSTAIAIPDSNLINLGGPFEERSIELWFLADDVDNRQILYEEGSTARGLSIYIDNDNVYAGIWNRTANGDGTTPWPTEPFLSAPIEVGLPYHLVFTYEFAADNVELYMNGSSVTSVGNVGRWFAHGDDIGIGAMNGGTRFHTNGQSGGNTRTYTGVLDEVAVYNNVLTPQQVTNHFTGSGPNQPPVVDAGGDFIVTLPFTGMLDGTVTDDNPVTTTWSVTSGPGTVMFGNVNALDTTVDFSTDGSYVLRLTAFDGEFTEFDEVYVTVEPEPVNQPPSASAGPDLTIEMPNGAALNGTVDDDGLPLPPGFTTTNWSKFSGPGTVTFSNANAVDTTATFSVDGTYVLRLTANDGEYEVTSDVTVTVDPEPPNQPPTVDAGADFSVELPAVANLDGTVSDDGKPEPPGSVTTTWSKFSGPGTVTFGNANAVDTTASFSQDGVYVLRLTADDGEFEVTADVTVTVDPEPPNLPPSVDAGSDFTVELPASGSLDGTVSDDGRPDPPGAVTTTWSKVSGPGTVTFGNVSAVDTSVSFSTEGTYVLRLTADDGEFNPSDTVTVTVDPPSLTYEQLVLADNPVAYWRFDETSGSTAFDSAGSGNAQIRGGAAKGQAGLIGDGTSFRFDGNNDWVDVPDINGVNLGGPWEARTVELWLRADGVSSRQVVYEEGSTSRGLSITIESGSLNAGIWNRTSNGGDPTTPWADERFVSHSISANTTYHVVLVYDMSSNIVRLFVNGSQVDTVSGVGRWYAHGDDIGIAARNGGVRFINNGQSGGNLRAFDGRIDEVAIYNSALTAGAIGAHYNAG